jgi:hypothetical protein
MSMQSKRCHKHATRSNGTPQSSAPGKAPHSAIDAIFVRHTPTTTQGFSRQVDGAQQAVMHPQHVHRLCEALAPCMRHTPTAHTASFATTARKSELAINRLSQSSCGGWCIRLAASGGGTCSERSGGTVVVCREGLGDEG